MTTVKLSSSQSHRLATIKNRLSARLAQATPQQIEEGKNWYARVLQSFDGIHPTITPRQIAAVIAAVSPRMQWERNLIVAAILIDHHATDPTTPPPGLCMGREKSKAWAAMSDATSIDRWAGLRDDQNPKTRAFLANIDGDPVPVTVDIWAHRAASGQHQPSIPLSNKGEYELHARAYREVAAAHGLDNSACQAIIWTVVRDAA